MSTNDLKREDAPHAPAPVLKDLLAVSFQLEQLEKDLAAIRRRLETYKPGDRFGIAIHAAMLSSTVITQHLLKMGITLYDE